MDQDAKQILRTFRPVRIMLPVIIGLGVVIYLLWHDSDKQALLNIRWTWNSSAWLGVALFMMVVRDFSYMIRIRVLTDNQLDWYRSFIVIMLWEFASALAPGIIGGGFFFAMFILNREGVNMGKSITAIMNSSFLDGIFLAIMAPIVYWVVGKELLFSGLNLHGVFGGGIFYAFWLIYFIILAYKLFVAYALFVNPYFVKILIVKLFSFPFLVRFKRKAIETGNQLIIASEELKKQNWKYWMNSLGATFASWTARFIIVNCLVHAFNPASLGFMDNLAIYGKQVIMGIIIITSVTPGGSGIAELMFVRLLNEFIATGLAPTLSFLWRLLSYYPYLIIGVIILPRWIRQKFTKAEIISSDIKIV